MARMSSPVTLVAVTVLSLGLAAGCAVQQEKAPAEPATAKAPSPAVTQALDSARTAIKNARSHDWIWRDTEKFLKQAEEAARKGDDARAISLANKARSQAELAVNQYYLEKAKPMLARAQAGRLTAAQKQIVEEAKKAIRDAQGRKAYDLLMKLDQAGS
jgi:SRSO17 transposase